MTERQLTLIEDLRPEVISCTPSYALMLAQGFREHGVSPTEISLRFAVLGAEPWTERMRVAIDEGLAVSSTNIYGLSEIVGPGVSCECVEERSGSHVNEDHFFPEIVDPESGQPLQDGDEGVLVLTTLTKQALPLVRFWTGDICSLDRSPCSCGRTLARMGAILGRTDDMLIVRGVNVYPSQVGAVLGRIPELSPHFGLVVRRLGTLDEVEVLVEVNEDVVASLALIEPHVDGLELNASCPNVSWGRDTDTESHLRALVAAIRERTPRPLFVKLPPFATPVERDVVLALASIAQEAGASGLTCSNTRLVREPRLSVGSGGLSGRALWQRTASIVADTDMICYGMTFWEFRPVVEADGRVAWKLLQALAAKLRAAQQA